MDVNGNSNYDYIKNGWFYERDTFKTGYTQGLKISKVLYHEHSKYQDIFVFNNEYRGNVLAIDGAIQCVENDEFVYQEMMAFLPVNSHRDPRTVLVLGGGDGGILRELNKSPYVQKITLCEIDENVLHVSRRFLPGMAIGFQSPKVKIIIQDAYDFLKECPQKFDVIICDISDPDGPSERLYSDESIECMFNALNNDGILCLQSESMWLSMPLIRNLLKQTRRFFPVIKYAPFYTPTYPAGQIGALLCSKNEHTDFTSPIHILDPEEYSLKYYSPEVHSSSFVLPEFLKAEFEKLIQ